MKTPRILVIRGGAIGDFIMTLPALAALREQWPDGHIEILGYPHITELARGRYYADATRSVEARALAGFFVPNGILDPGWMEYFGGFNLVISYLFDPDEIFSDNVRRCGVKHFVPASPRPVSLHATEHYCKPLEMLAIYVGALEPRIFPSDEDRLFAGNYLAPLDSGKIVAIHPGSGGEKKNWPVEKFADVAQGLMDEGYQLLIVKGEADEAAVRLLESRLDSSHYKVVLGLTLTELAAVLARCEGFVGNDSGITHLATAVGTPVVALFGPASTTIWEPRGKKVRVVRFGGSDVDEVRRTLGEWLER